MLAIISLLLYAFGWWLDYWLGVDWFRALPAFLVLFIAPGYTLWSVLPIRTSRVERLFLGFTSSVLLTPAILFAYTRLDPRPLTPRFATWEAVAVLLGLTGIAAALSHFSQESAPREPLLQRIQVAARAHSILWWAMATFIALHIASFVIYPFIPEADGYSVIARIRETVLSGILPSTGYRPLFPLLCAQFSFLSGWDPIPLFKWMLPLATSLTLIPLYLVGRRYQLKRPLLFLATLTPLTVPVIFQETEIIRTQTSVFLVTYAVLWLLWRFQKEQRIEYWIAAFLAAGFSLLAHEMAAFLLLTTILVAIPTYRYHLRHSRVTTLFCTVIAIAALIPYCTSSSLLGSHLSSLAQTFSRLRSPRLDLWFIDSYTNVDGNRMGWPGLQSILYYGYDLGLFLLLVPLSFLSWKRSASERPYPTAPLIFVVVFLTIAELFPRLGVAYLPDRAWLFIGSGLLFTVPHWLSRLAPLITPQRNWRLFAVPLLLAGCAASLLVTYLKQGWVTRNEYAAATWIRSNTSTQAVFITQGGNSPLIQGYAQRSLIANLEFFKLDAEAQQAYAENLHPSQTVIPVSAEDVTRNALAEEQAAWNTFSQLAAQTRGTGSAELSNRVEAVTKALLTWEQKKREAIRFQAVRPDVTLFPPAGETPLYVLFSDDKFHTLYSLRLWWKDVNAYGFDPKSLDTRIFKPVYASGNVFIFRFQPST